MECWHWDGTRNRWKISPLFWLLQNPSRNPLPIHLGAAPVTVGPGVLIPARLYWIPASNAIHVLTLGLGTRY